MGDFVIRIHAVGGHGHHRTVRNGETIPDGCDVSPTHCVDCLTRKFVEDLKNLGEIKVASLTHWDAELPGYAAEYEVRDDLLTNKRRGQF